MKKTYLKPALQVATLQQQGIICTSGVRSVNGNAGIDFGGGSSGPVRAPSRRGTDWDNYEW